MTIGSKATAWAGRLLLAAMLTIGIAAPAGADDYPVGTSETMWSDPNMIGSYRHWDEIYPVRVIPRADAPLPLAYGTPVDEIVYRRGDRQFTIDEYFERTRATGVIVIRDDAIVFERYGHGAGEASLMTSMSVAKSFVSTLVGFAIQDGLIESVDDPIDRYIPDLAGTGYETVPIRAVLQMSSGVRFVEDYGSPNADSMKLWLETVHYRTKRLNDFIVEMQRRDPPYADFNYKGVDTAALGWLVTKVTGRTLSDYLAEKIWKPLGMEADANWGLDGRGADATEIAFCCLNARLRDYARFGLFMLHRGNWNGAQLLSADWIAEATVPNSDQVAYGALHEGYGPGYGYQWWALPGPDGAYTAIGVNGQFLYINPARNMVVAASHVWKEFWSSPLEREFFALIDAFIEATE